MIHLKFSFSVFMNWYSWLVSNQFFSLGSIAYKLFENFLNFTICLACDIVMPVLHLNPSWRIYFILMTFVMKILLYHTSLMYGMLDFWLISLALHFYWYAMDYPYLVYLISILGYKKLRLRRQCPIWYFLSYWMLVWMNSVILPIQSPDFISFLINWFHSCF